MCTLFATKCRDRRHCVYLARSYLSSGLRFPVGGKWKYVGAVVRCNWRREGRYRGGEWRGVERSVGQRRGEITAVVRCKLQTWNHSSPYNNLFSAMHVHSVFPPPSTPFPLFLTSFCASNPFPTLPLSPPSIPPSSPPLTSLPIPLQLLSLSITLPYSYCPLLSTCWKASMPSSSISTMTKNSCEEYCCEYRQELAMIMYSSYASLEEREGERRREMGRVGGREVGGKRVHKITMDEMRGWEGRKRDKQEPGRRWERWELTQPLMQINILKQTLTCRCCTGVAA